MADIPIFSSNAVLVLKITDQHGKDYIYIDYQFYFKMAG
jgi:hypothetical protein